ncbi:hypothetical protein I3842_16G020100 [Carya illinoinensis]|uniref:Uncharacterized protein n=1 Tax=Carya illinoinensis TaxID=32201 RepID=A0A921ZZL0_CARIL|nr:hypothetical protein I3842_16G020100 [Carya illinoinensis]
MARKVKRSEKRQREREMAMSQLNQDGKAVGDMVLKKQDEGVKLNPGGDHAARSETEPRFKPKAGSVFPKKKKLVQRMMRDYMIQSCANSFPGRVSDDGEC